VNRWNPSLDRRRLLRDGGLAISLGALVAACGSNRGGVDAPGRIGVAEGGEEARDTEVNDVVLLRTAQSLEYTALDVYAAAAGLGVLDDAGTALVERFVQDHTGHASQVGSLIGGLGGEEFACANPFLVERVVEPVLGAITGSDDVLRDVIHTAYAIEEFAGRSYQALVTALTDGELRREAMRIGGEEQRHAAVLATVLNPDQILSPALVGEIPAETDELGFPVRFAVPSTFGQLTGVTLVVGDVDPDGGRFSTTLQTPAANTFVYEDQAC
jgi:hypothetical protein